MSALSASFVRAFTPQEFGAVANGTADDTVAIERAHAAALTTKGYVYFPPGNYRYAGTGLTGTDINLRGAGGLASRIAIDPGKYLIDDDRSWRTVNIEGLYFDGGAGVLRNRYSPANVVSFFRVKDCRFENYTVCPSVTTR